MIIVTGACGLLGRSHCEAIASVGGIPVVLDLDQFEADKFASQISQKYSVESKGFSVDITNEMQIAENNFRAGLMNAGTKAYSTGSTVAGTGNVTKWGA